MDSTRSAGRGLGVLLLVQMACGLVTPFVLLRPPFVNFPDYLTAFAPNAGTVRSAVFISLVGSALTVAIGVRLWPILSNLSRVFGVVVLAVCIVSCVLDLIQDATVMAMLSMSERYIESGSDPVYQAVGAGIAAIRKWAHYTQLIGFGAWIFTFYYSMFRYRLLPWALSGLGIAGIISQFIGVTLLTFLGLGQVSQMAMPLAPIHVATAVWLIVKGFQSEAVKQSEPAVT